MQNDHQVWTVATDVWGKGTHRREAYKCSMCDSMRRERQRTHLGWWPLLGETKGEESYRGGLCGFSCIRSITFLKLGGGYIGLDRVFYSVEI